MKIAGVLLGVALGAATLLLLLREEGETLTEAGLREARERWEAADVSDYDLAISVRGAQSGDHAVRVRGGVVVSMTTGGEEVPERVRPYWSVDGLFRFLEEELENARRADEPSQYVLEAAFDGELGYPRRFLRHVLGGGQGIEWEVTDFSRR